MRVVDSICGWWSIGLIDMKSLLYVFILCGLYNYGFAIMCYECNSATNSMCLDKVLPDSLKRNCSEHDRGITHTMCRKIVQHVEHGVNGRLPESRVIRSCGWDESKFKGTCYHRAGYGGRQEVCSCLKDYCNTGHQESVTTWLLSATIMLAVKKICD